MIRRLIILLLIVGCEEDAPTDHTHTDYGICVSPDQVAYDSPVVHCYERTHKYTSYPDAMGHLTDPQAMTENLCENLGGSWYTSYQSCSEFCEEWCSLKYTFLGIDICADTTGVSGECNENL